jgi:hypothetical protein
MALLSFLPALSPGRDVWDFTSGHTGKVWLLDFMDSDHVY